MDAVALTHDINYLYSGTDEQMLSISDNLAVEKAGRVWGTMMGAGFYLRKVFGLGSNRDRNVAHELRDIVLHDARYAEARKIYGIDDGWFVF